MPMVRPAQIHDRVGLQTALQVLFERFEGGYLALASQAGVGQATVHDMVSGKTFPRWGTVEAVLNACEIPAGDFSAWRAAYERAKNDVPSTGSGPGRPLTEFIDPFALEVHRPIQADIPDTSDLPVLPAYVRRTHDERLDAIVGQAAEGTSSIAVLVAGSSTGKTRACWESLTRLREAGWRLWHPIDPTRPDAALKDLTAVGPHTVIWLNEAQFYLDHPLGEQVAAGLRELLRDPDRSPVLILATLWPEHWAALTTRPTDGLDPHAQARQLIVGNELHVPMTFTDDDAHLLARASALDRRLATAASEAVNGQITQYLAGVPILLDRYTHAPPAARALIHAAMDARRLGHGPHLSHALLAEAAPGYLTDLEWDAVDDNWLEAALAYTAQPGNGIPGPLTRIRPRTPSSGEPAYRLADYLEHVGRSDRDLLSTPTELWDAFLEHAPESDRSTLASAAGERGYYRYCLRLYASIPSAASFMSAAQILRTAERVDEALGYYTRAADAGADEDAVGSAAYMLREARGAEAALSWLKARGDVGDATAMRLASQFLQAEGRIEEAGVWWARAGNANDPEALVLLAESMQSSGREEQAGEIFRRAAQAAAASVSHQSDGTFGTEHAVSFAAQCLMDAGDTADAVVLLLPQVQRGNHSALRMAADLIRRTEGLDEALTWLDSLVGAVKCAALNTAGIFLRQAGRIDEALVYFQRAGQIGDTKDCVHALEQAASILRERGQIDEALEAYQRAADAGDRLGDKSYSPVNEAAAMLRANGRLDQALDWLTARADDVESPAVVVMAETLRDEGQSEEAFAWLTRYADAGSVSAIREGAWMLWQAGRVDETIAWIETRSADVDASALGQMAEMLGEAGRLDRALEYSERACNSGDRGGFFFGTSVRLLAAAGCTTEARRLHRFGREPDGRISDPWTSAGAPHDEDDDAELSLPATPPEPFRVTPRPSDILEIMMKKAQVSTFSELFEVMMKKLQASKSDT
jgi:tetratricopeptide (TPR) repeat protein